MNFKNWPLSWKISSLMISVAILSILALSAVGFYTATKALKNAEYNKLIAIRDIKKNQIEKEFHNIFEQLHLFDELPISHQAFLAFDKAFGEVPSVSSAMDRNQLRDFYQSQFIPKLNSHSEKEAKLGEYFPKSGRSQTLQARYIATNKHPLGEKHRLTDTGLNNSYDRAHAQYHSFMADFLEVNGFYDIFLINLQGDIIYSVYKEADFATNLMDGPHKNDHFNEAYQKALTLERDNFHLVDYKPYWASYNKTASFVTAPFYHDDELVGVIAFQMPVERINKLMTFDKKWKEHGMGESGEIYLIGADSSLRTESRFYSETPKDYLELLERMSYPSELIGKIKTQNTTIGLQKTNSIAASKGLAGEKGVAEITDYRAAKVLSAYAPLKVLNLDWAILAEVDEEEAFSSINELMQTSLLITLILCVIIAVLARIAAKAIAKPLVKFSNTLQTIAESGDLSLRVDHDSKDEIGNSITSFHGLLERWQGILKGISNSSQRLMRTAEEIGQNGRTMTGNSEALRDNSAIIASASEEITINVSTVAGAADETANNVINVTGAIEELSANIASISAATEEASVNMNGISDNVQKINHETTTVANAMEEMTSTMNEIADNTKKGMDRVETANASSQSNLEIMNALGDSANKIGKVVKLISNIAAQTNMLALNATIEATNAGAAGKGFAVVAEEVKELAQQSASANSEIAEQISKIQSQISNALDHTEEVTKVINEVAEINRFINTTVSEQNKTAKEITRSIEMIVQSSEESTRNVQEAGSGMQEIARSVSEASLASKESVDNLSRSTHKVKEIARSTDEASTGVGDVNRNLQSVQKSVESLNQEIANVQRNTEQITIMSQELNDLISVFKV